MRIECTVKDSSFNGVYFTNTWKNCRFSGFKVDNIGKGTVVKNSILMQDTYTGENVLLNCVITDKNVMIKDGRTLSGCETMPFYIGKNGAI